MCREPRIPHAFFHPVHGMVRSEQLYLRFGYHRYLPEMLAKTDASAHYKRVLSLTKEWNFATSHFMFSVLPMVSCGASGGTPPPPPRTHTPQPLRLVLKD